MVISLQKALLLAILVLVLLIGLIGWSMRASANPISPHSHSIAIECPPPPYNCG